jgi:hypothetical protein
VNPFFIVAVITGLISIMSFTVGINTALKDIDTKDLIIRTSNLESKIADVANMRVPDSPIRIGDGSIIYFGTSRVVEVQTVVKELLKELDLEIVTYNKEIELKSVKKEDSE